MEHTKGVKIAFVKDWLTSYGGSEEQLLQLHRMYPDAPIYTSVYDRERLPEFARADIRTMNVPKYFTKARNFEKLALLLPHYFKSLDFNGYQIVVSVTSGFAKGIRTKPSTKHLCICNTPLRFAWNFGGDKRGVLSKIMSPYFRWYDKASSKDVDVYYANSHNIAKRIKQVYARSSKVLYPPVNVQEFSAVKRSNKPEGFITIGRLVPYKKVDIAVTACTKLSLPLTVIGDGPELLKLKSMSGKTVKFLGFASKQTIMEQLAKAKVFIFCADEDFGIAPVEAMAAGCPVIAYKSGGALETVIDGVTGTFFSEQTVDSLLAKLKNIDQYSTTKIKNQAEKFSEKFFRQRVKNIIDETISSDFVRLLD